MEITVKETRGKWFVYLKFANRYYFCFWIIWKPRVQNKIRNHKKFESAKWNGNERNTGQAIFYAKIANRCDYSCFWISRKPNIQNKKRNHKKFEITKWNGNKRNTERMTFSMKLTMLYHCSFFCISRNPTTQN